jgi:hypothetical protein
MSQPAATSNDCGSCTVCCHSLRVIELDKPAGILCQHCVPGKGCGIYETRFEICRSFLCGWRQVPQLGETWRPDVSGVLMLTQELDKVPEMHRAAGRGINFVILGGEKAILRPGFAEYVSTLVARNVAVYLSADTPKTLLNQYLHERVARHDKPAVIEMLLHVYRLHVQMRAANNRAPMPWIEMPG